MTVSLSSLTEETTAHGDFRIEFFICLEQSHLHFETDASYFVVTSYFAARTSCIMKKI